MSWAEAKKINSDLTVPLNCMIIADNLQILGDASFFYADKQFVEALVSNKIFVNMKSITERICLESIKQGLGRKYLSMLDVDIARMVLANNSCVDAIISGRLIGDAFSKIDDVGWGFDYQTVKSTNDFESADWLTDFCANVIENEKMPISAMTRFLRSNLDAVKKNKNAVVLSGAVSDFENFKTNVYSGRGLYVNTKTSVSGFTGYSFSTYVDNASVNTGSALVFEKNLYGSFVRTQGAGGSYAASMEILCLKRE